MIKASLLFIASLLTIEYVCLHVCYVEIKGFLLHFQFLHYIKREELTRCIFDHCKLQRCTETQTQIQNVSSLVFFIYASSFLFVKCMTFERYLFPFHRFQIYIYIYIYRLVHTIFKYGAWLTINHCPVNTINYFQFQMFLRHVHLKRSIARLIC